MGQELATMREKYRVLCGVLDERGRRVWAAAEANSLPHGGVSLVANATGLSRSTIHAGLRELGKDRGEPLGAGRSRKAGGGRKPLTFHNPDLLKALEKLVEPTTRGDPESPSRLTCKSTYLLAEELQRQGYGVALLGSCGTFSAFTPQSGQRARYNSTTTVSETRNRAGLVLRAHRCHRPRPASARNPSTPVFGSLTYVEPIASAVSPPRRFRADRLDILVTPILCSNRYRSSLLSVTRVP
jgi:Rhodopirellula transposase DDE domain